MTTMTMTRLHDTDNGSPQREHATSAPCPPLTSLAWMTEGDGHEEGGLLVWDTRKMSVLDTFTLEYF